MEQLVFILIVVVIVIIALIFGAGYLFAIMGLKAIWYVLAAIGVLAILKTLL